MDADTNKTGFQAALVVGPNTVKVKVTAQDTTITDADMMIRRLAVHVPQSCPLRANDLARASAQVAWTDSDGVVVSELQRADDDDAMASRYEKGESTISNNGMS